MIIDDHFTNTPRSVAPSIMRGFISGRIFTIYHIWGVAWIPIAIRSKTSKTINLQVPWSERVKMDEFWGDGQMAIHVHRDSHAQYIM
jgi:hypothetical protein